MCCLNVIIGVKSTFEKRDYMIDVELSYDGLVANSTNAFVTVKDDLGINWLYEKTTRASAAC
jgi:hypothetical protein